MSSPPVQLERRVGQRFPFELAVSLRDPLTSIQGAGVTQNLSSRGVFLFTDMALAEGTEIELSLRMPSEITLGDSMPVRCRGHVLRLSRQAVSSGNGLDPKIGVAVRFESYEYLSEADASGSVRMSSLHPSRGEDHHLGQPSAARFSD